MPRSSDDCRATYRCRAVPLVQPSGTAPLTAAAVCLALRHRHLPALTLGLNLGKLPVAVLSFFHVPGGELSHGCTQSILPYVNVLGAARRAFTTLRRSDGSSSGGQDGEPDLEAGHLTSDAGSASSVQHRSSQQLESASALSPSAGSGVQAEAGCSTGENSGDRIYLPDMGVMVNGKQPCCHLDVLIHMFAIGVILQTPSLSLSSCVRLADNLIKLAGGASASDSLDSTAVDGSTAERATRQASSSEISSVPLALAPSPSATHGIFGRLLRTNSGHLTGKATGNQQPVCLICLENLGPDDFEVSRPHRTLLMCSLKR